MHQKRVPLRMCAGCGESKPKKELVRVVRSPEGEISLDLTGKKPGRGAYVCKSADCTGRREKRGDWNEPSPARFPQRSMTVWRRRSENE